MSRLIRLLLVGWLTAGCGPQEQPPAAGTASPEGSTSPPVRVRDTPFVRVLGTVQDGGLPHAACSCTRCEAARTDPKRKRYITSLALVLAESGEVYLFDATPDIREQLVLLQDIRRPPTDRVDRSPVDGIFLTHAHIGHYLGLAFLGYEAVHTNRLPVMATPRMAEFLHRNGPWSQLVELENIRLVETVPGTTIELAEGVTVTAIQAPHRDEYADTLGFRIEGPESSLLYLPDTDSWEAWSEPLPEALAGLDVALLDGTFFSLDELPGRRVESIGHPLISRTLDLLEESVRQGQLQVFFTHLNHSNPALEPASPERQAIETRGFAVLNEGQEFPL